MAPATTELPPTVKTVRVLLFILAGLTGMTVLGGIFAFWPLDAAGWGYLTYVALPGILALALGLGLHRGGQTRFWLTIALAVLTLLLAIANLSDTPVQALVQFLLPGLILYFLTRPDSRDYFRAPPR